MDSDAEPASTHAFISWSRWVADCPKTGCTNALEVHPGQELFRCAPPTGCGGSGPIRWPGDPDAVMGALAGLPEAQQSWHPRDEPQEQEQS